MEVMTRCEICKKQYSGNSEEVIERARRCEMLGEPLPKTLLGSLVWVEPKVNFYQQSLRSREGKYIVVYDVLKQVGIDFNLIDVDIMDPRKGYFYQPKLSIRIPAIISRFTSLFEEETHAPILDVKMVDLEQYWSIHSYFYAENAVVSEAITEQKEVAKFLFSWLPFMELGSPLRGDDVKVAQRLFDAVGMRFAIKK